jgi:hypothetical protein
MARVSGGRQWPDGDRVWFLVKADDDFPEALLQAELVAADLFRDLVAVVMDGHDGKSPALELAGAEWGVEVNGDELGGD